MIHSCPLTSLRQGDEGVGRKGGTERERGGGGGGREKETDREEESNETEEKEWKLG